MPTTTSQIASIIVVAKEASRQIRLWDARIADPSYEGNIDAAKIDRLQAIGALREYMFQIDSLQS